MYVNLAVEATGNIVIVQLELSLIEWKRQPSLDITQSLRVIHMSSQVEENAVFAARVECPVDTTIVDIAASQGWPPNPEKR